MLRTSLCPLSSPCITPRASASSSSAFQRRNKAGDFFSLLGSLGHHPVRVVETYGEPTSTLLCRCGHRRTYSLQFTTTSTKTDRRVRSALLLVFRLLLFLILIPKRTTPRRSPYLVEEETSPALLVVLRDLEDFPPPPPLPPPSSGRGDGGAGFSRNLPLPSALPVDDDEEEAFLLSSLPTDVEARLEGVVLEEERDEAEEGVSEEAA